MTQQSYTVPNTKPWYNLWVTRPWMIVHLGQNRKRTWSKYRRCCCQGKPPTYSSDTHN